MLRALASVAALALFSGCSLIGIRSGYEQPAYTVVERIGERVEIRRYGSRLAAETTVAASDAGQARNESFEILFDYISGKNRGGSKVAMTAPVEVGAGAEKTAMTVLVEMSASDVGGIRCGSFLRAPIRRPRRRSRPIRGSRLSRSPKQPSRFFASAGLGTRNGWRHAKPSSLES
jgi:hypothetical protein